MRIIARNDKPLIQQKPGQIEAPAFRRFKPKTLLITALLTLLYLLWVTQVLGVRQDHYLLLGVCLIAYFGNATSRKVFWGFLFMLLYWLLYDAMRIYPNYMLNPVHIQEPYVLEKLLFGITTDSGQITFNEYFAQHTHPVLDIASAVFYLCWVPVPLMYAAYLFVKDKSMLLQFGLAFLMVNLIGIAIYYIYPAAPPWYVDTYGFTLQVGTPGNAAGLLRFDEFFGISLFSNMYEKNANVFAAIPSLHAAFPVILLYFGLKKKLKYASLLFFIILVGIWFAAVYTFHHYFIDVLAGGMSALLSIGLYEFMMRKTRVKSWLNSYLLLVN